MPASETDKLILQRLESLEKQNEKLIHLLEGNGAPGLKIRVDRLEQSEDRRKWIVRTLGAGVVTALVTAAKALFFP